MRRIYKIILCGLCLGATLAVNAAEENILNLYSSRHYDTDEKLYSNFTQRTGIRINRIEGKDDELLERIVNEGAASPADILITVDAARLARADEMGLLAPVRSALLEKRIPAQLRTKNWFAFSTRARLLVYNKASVAPTQITRYQDLAKPDLKGQVCSRSGSHPYNLSLLAALIAHEGEAAAEKWASAVVANFARSPKGGDTDQIRAVAAGECGVTIANSYYLVRLMQSMKPEDQKAVANIGFVWPNQKDVGAHINISGGGLLKTAQHKKAALAFLEYLASDEAQAYFSNGNNEWPAVSGVRVTNPSLAALGTFKADALPVASFAQNIAKAQKIYDRVGWR